MKRFFFVILLFLVACEPAEPESMAPAPEPAPEVQAPAVSEPEEVEEPSNEEAEGEDSVDEVEPPVEEPEIEEPDSETSTEESSEESDESDSEETDESDESTGEESESSDTSTEESSDSSVFTAQTLAYYDGQEGRPAYVAVNGVVYDVTSSSRWRDGAHNGFQAGRDLTRQFNNQHGDSRLDRFPIVGTYQD